MIDYRQNKIQKNHSSKKRLISILGNQWFFPYFGFLNYLEVSKPFWKYKSIGGGVGIFFGAES